MESCVKCHFYDRKNARAGDNRTALWGQCRRHSPLLNPLNTKSYAIEGVWPTVRDDDWCGEWRSEVSRPAERVAELLNGPTPIHRPKVTALTTGALPASAFASGAAGND